MLEEHVLLRENDVLVSNSRFVIDNVEAYAMSGIVSVKLEKGSWKVDKIRLIIGLLVIVFGFAEAVSNQPSKSLASFLILFGLIVMVISLKKYPHLIEFRTSSGEVEIYSDDNEEFVEKLFKALNDSIIFRG